jgi:hypothetical protein
MNDNLLKTYTKDFEDISCTLAEIKSLKRQEMRLRRKLKTLELKYSFLRELVGIDNEGETISLAVKKLFIELGFNNIQIIPEKQGIEDLRLFVDNKLFIIETTGTEKEGHRQSKTNQISIHIPFRRKEFKDLEVIGLFITNHDNKKDFQKRNKKPFPPKYKEVAKHNNYTITTTVDLFNAFILFKQGKITPSEIIDKLSETGEFKILESTSKSE